MMEMITVDAVEDSLDEINDFLNEIISGFTEDSAILFQIELTVEEIVVNIVSYAYEDEETVGRLEVGCEVNEETGEAVISFSDWGKAFDPLQAKEADLSGKMFMEQAGGFGIHMVKETMDEVSYERKDGKNILTVKKKLRNGSKQPEAG